MTKAERVALTELIKAGVADPATLVLWQEAMGKLGFLDRIRCLPLIVKKFWK